MLLLYAIVSSESDYADFAKVFGVVYSTAAILGALVARGQKGWLDEDSANWLINIA